MLAIAVMAYWIHLAHSNEILASGFLSNPARVGPSRHQTQGHRGLKNPPFPLARIFVFHLAITNISRLLSCDVQAPHRFR